MISDSWGQASDETREVSDRGFFFARGAVAVGQVLSPFKPDTGRKRVSQRSQASLQFGLNSLNFCRGQSGDLRALVGGGDGQGKNNGFRDVAGLGRDCYVVFSDWRGWVQSDDQSRRAG